MACSACGTARARASTAPATCSATPISPAPQRTAACSRLMGDDHTAESSTTAHQSEFHFVDVMMPILNPAGVQEIIDYALYGWAMSRFTGAWTALKCMHETVESTGVVDGSLDRIKLVTPTDFRMPDGGLNIRLVDTILGQEARLHDFKRDAMLAFVRANKLNKHRHLGRAQSEDRHHHHRQGLSRRAPGARRTRHRRSEMQRPRPAPVQDRLRLADRPPGTGGVRAGARSHHRGRGEALADRSAGARGTLRHRQSAGLHRQEGRAGQLAVPGQGRARSQRRRDLHRRAAAALRRQRRTGGQCRAAEIGAARARAKPSMSPSAFPISARAARTTPRPACRKAAAPMPASAATTWRSGWTARRSATRRWAARAPTGSARRRSPSARHVFQNLGDGTYNHSGNMAIRAAIASGVKMTYKILFNDAVAMTGGQANDGGLTVDQIARQVAAEGASRVVVVTDEPWKYPKDTDWPRGLTVHHRDELDARAARAHHRAGRQRAHLRPDLRRREAPPPQARHLPRSRQARGDQRSGLRRLRRLRREIELRLGAAADDRMGPQAHHRPVELQQGLFLRQGLLPVLRHRARRQAQEGRRRRRAGGLAGAARRRACR